MSDAAQTLALVFAGIALGWTAMFSFLAAPQAFRDLDAGRASRFVRTAMRNGHPAVAAFCGVAAGAALLASAIGGAAVLALSACLYLLARWTLAPRDDERPANARRKLSTARVVASALTFLLMLAVAAATVLVALRI